MGNGSSKLEKSLSQLPEGERYFGLENFGNTCYCNSVLQSLYFCQPFRDRLLSYAAGLSANAEENLLTCLADLFQQIHTQRKRTGVIQPRPFVQRLKRDNELFRSYMHQDAHEFLNYLLNECSELLEKEARNKDAQEKVNKFLNGMRHLQPPPAPASTWVTDIFQGKLVNETRCLRCERVTSREEAFYDLSLEIEQHSSLTACLRKFSSTETLDAEDKFFCDMCQCLQEAQKRMKIKQLPQVLCLHLKRFKYNEHSDKLRKLMYRVVFPFDLKLRNTTDDCTDADQSYSLFAVVVHVGSGPNHGHYVSFIKSHEKWLFFDDEQVDACQESHVHTAFGAATEQNGLEHGYILMYSRNDAHGGHLTPLATQTSLQSKRSSVVQ